MLGGLGRAKGRTRSRVTVAAGLGRSFMRSPDAPQMMVDYLVGCDGDHHRRQPHGWLPGDGQFGVPVLPRGDRFEMYGAAISTASTVPSGRSNSAST